MNNKVIVEINSKDTPYKNILKDFGFSFNDKENHWEKNNIKSRAFIDCVKKYFKKKNIVLKVLDNDFERNNSYRNEFLKQHKKIFNGYFCAYCGEHIRKDEMTVDHIISVASAKNNKNIRNILKILGIKNINDIKNLTPACKACNCKKDTNLKGWILRGYLGRFDKLWYFRILLEFCFYSTAIFTILDTLLEGQLWFLNI